MFQNSTGILLYKLMLSWDCFYAFSVYPNFYFKGYY
jgi:hypothetical protein